MSIRSTLLACITALASIAILIAYVHKNTRYDMVGGQDGVYVLDRQTTLMHHCDKKKCRLLSPEGSSVDAMRALSGVPSVDLVRKKQPATCVVPEQKAEKHYKNVNISSFQSVAQPMPSMNELKESSADDLGMPQVNQQVQKPQSPFVKQNEGVPSSPAPAQSVPAAPAESSSSDDAKLAAKIQADNNPYGGQASGAVANKVANPSSSDSSGGYPGASDAGNSSSDSDSDPYSGGGGSGSSSDSDSDPYSGGGDSGSSSDSSGGYPGGK